LVSTLLGVCLETLLSLLGIRHFLGIPILKWSWYDYSRLSAENQVVTDEAKDHYRDGEPVRESADHGGIVLVGVWRVGEFLFRWRSSTDFWKIFLPNAS
jgi:hypothetical protein